MRQTLIRRRLLTQRHWPFLVWAGWCADPDQRPCLSLSARILVNLGRAERLGIDEFVEVF